MTTFFKSKFEQFDLWTANEDGDTEDDSYHMRVPRNYYKNEKRQLPSFIPPDPKAPVRAAPAQMVSSSNIPLSSYAPPVQQSDTRSLRAQNGIGQAGRREPSPSPSQSFIGSIPRSNQPAVAAAPAAPLSQSARLKAQFGKSRSGSPGPSSNPVGAAPPSLRSASPYEAPAAPRNDNRPVAGGSYGRDQYSARPAAAQAAPAMSANSPWASGGDDYNGFSSYGSSSPFGESDRASNGVGRQGLPNGPRSGLVRGPRGMQT